MNKKALCCRCFYLLRSLESIKKIKNNSEDIETTKDMLIQTGYEAGKGYSYTCKNLDKNRGICKIYNRRPSICRNYPKDGKCAREKECETASICNGLKKST